MNDGNAFVTAVTALAGVIGAGLVVARKLLDRRDRRLLALGRAIHGTYDDETNVVWASVRGVEVRVEASKVSARVADAGRLEWFVGRLAPNDAVARAWVPRSLERELLALDPWVFGLRDGEAFAERKPGDHELEGVVRATAGLAGRGVTLRREWALLAKRLEGTVTRELKLADMSSEGEIRVVRPGCELTVSLHNTPYRTGTVLGDDRCTTVTIVRADTGDVPPFVVRPPAEEGPAGFQRVPSRDAGVDGTYSLWVLPDRPTLPPIEVLRSMLAARPLSVEAVDRAVVLRLRGIVRDPRIVLPAVECVAHLAAPGSRPYR